MRKKLNFKPWLVLLTGFVIMVLSSKAGMALKSADVDNNGVTNTNDLKMVLAAWFSEANGPENVYDSDNKVNIIDYSYVMQALGGMKAEVVGGMLTNARLVPKSDNYTSSATVTQDTGYYIRLASDGLKINQLPMEIAYEKSTGGYDSYIDLKNEAGQALVAQNGVITVDFTEFPPQPVKTYRFKLRVKGTALESNPVAVEVKPIDAEDYFRYFQPGNYWVHRCIEKNSQGQYQFCQTTSTPYGTYESRIDIENTRTVDIIFEGRNTKLTSNPWRVDVADNSPDWSGRDFTFFPAVGYNPWKINGIDYNVKNCIATVFYKDFPENNLYHSLDQTCVFLPNETNDPPYYFITNPQDLTKTYFSENSFHGFKVYGKYDIATKNNSQVAITNDMIFNDESSAGWKVAFRMVKLDHPKFKGTALRIRFWEFGTAEFETNTDRNFDDWMWAKDYGFVAVNSRSNRGGWRDCTEAEKKQVPAPLCNFGMCKDDPDCNDETILMTPRYQVSMADSQIFADNDKLDLRTGKNNNFGLASTIKPGETYQLEVKVAKNQEPYSGYLEIQGNFFYPNGGSGPIQRQILKVSQPLKAVNGIVDAPTVASTPVGSYSIQVRPYIHHFEFELGPNRLAWSNLAELNIKSPYTQCILSTHSSFKDASNNLVESITKGPKFYNNYPGSSWASADLTSASNYTTDANAPCYGKTTGNCSFDSRVLLYDQNNDLIESITIGPRFFNKNYTGNTAWASGDLADNAHYKTNSHAACYGKAIGTCVFDARVLYREQGTNRLVEMVVIGSQYFVWDSTTNNWWSLSSHNLYNEPIYKENSDAPCYGKTAETCSFATLDRYYDQNNALIDTISTGEGYYYIYSYGQKLWTKMSDHQVSAWEKYRTDTNAPCYQ